MTTLQQVVDVLGKPSTFEQQLQSLATFASTALALLTAFTNRRSAVFDEEARI